MLRRHTFDRGARWFTLLALLLATLAPGVAHALRHARGELMPWSLLCSATGGKRVVVFEQRSDGSSPLQQAHAFEHCAYCALHADAGAAPDATAQPWRRADLRHAQPLPVTRRAADARAWRFGQPRAPPPLA